MYRARIESPFGPILLCGADKGLAGLYFIDQKDCPPVVGGLGVRPDSLRPASGQINGVPLRTLRPMPRAGREAAEQMALFPDGAQLNTGEQRAGDDIPDNQVVSHEASRVEASCASDRAARANRADRADGTGTAATSRARPSGQRSTSQAQPAELLQGDTPAGVVALFEQVRHELNQYFLGTRKRFDCPLDLAGTPFQLKVWQALCQVPYGELATYGELAAMAGLAAGHGRAVGTAVGRNPISIVVPCHRIIGANRTLTGYTGGLSRKVGLLELEGFTFNG